MFAQRLKDFFDGETCRVLGFSAGTLATSFTSLDSILKALISAATLVYLALKIRRAWRRRHHDDDDEGGD